MSNLNPQTYIDSAKKLENSKNLKNVEMTEIIILRIVFKHN